MKHKFCLLAIISLSFVLTSPTFAAGEIGKVTESIGTVTLSGADGQTRPGKTDAPIYVGDTVIAAAGADVQLKMSDMGVIDLHADSKLVIKAYSKQNVTLELLQGGVRSTTGAFTQLNPQGYQLKTAAASIGVRITSRTSHASYFIPTSGWSGAVGFESGLYEKVHSGRAYIQVADRNVELDSRYTIFVPSIGGQLRRLAETPPFMEEGSAVDSTAAKATPPPAAAK